MIRIVDIWNEKKINFAAAIRITAYDSKTHTKMKSQNGILDEFIHKMKISFFFHNHLGTNTNTNSSLASVKTVLVR